MWFLLDMVSQDVVSKGLGLEGMWSLKDVVSKGGDLSWTSSPRDVDSHGHGLTGMWSLRDMVS